MFTYAVASDPSVAGYAMVSDRFLAVLGADAGDTAAASLWNMLADPEATLADVLSVLAAAPPSDLADMAVIELIDVPSKSVSVAVRGAARVELDGAGDAVDGGRGAGAWSRGGAHEVSGMTLRLASAGGSVGTLPLARGVVRSDRLDWGPPPSPPEQTHTPEQAPAAEEVDPPLATVRRERLPQAEPLIDDRTELSRSARRRRPPVLRIGNERPVDLTLPVVLGRSPRPARHPGARLVTVPSPHREISGSHLEVHLDGDDLVARDLDSTNGTIVRNPDGSSMLLRQGAQVRVALGASLDLGEGSVAVFEIDTATTSADSADDRKG